MKAIKITEPKYTLTRYVKGQWVVLWLEEETDSVALSLDEARKLIEDLTKILEEEGLER